MKLLMCLDCGDIFNLTRDIKQCSCGKTKGRYTGNLNAVYTGNAQPIGFANSSFSVALQLQKIQDKHDLSEFQMGVKFEAFFIPKFAKSIVYEKEM